MLPGMWVFVNMGHRMTHPTQERNIYIYMLNIYFNMSVPCDQMFSANGISITYGSLI